MTSPGSEAALSAASLFGLASRTFAAEIDREFYRAIIVIIDASTEAEPGSDLLDPHIRAMDEETALNELSIEYCRLFIGPRPVCPPYASARPSSGHLGGKALRDITDFLHENSLMVSGLQTLPILAEDHIAVVLAILGQLLAAACGKGANILEPGQAARAACELRDHQLLDWAPQLLHSICESSQFAPYRPVAAFARSILLRDELFSSLRDQTLHCSRTR